MTYKSLPSVGRLEEIMKAGGKALHEELWKQAAAFFEMAVSLKPQFIEAWLGKATALRGIGDLKKAVEVYHKALEIDPQSRDAWTGLIETLHDLGKYKEEIEACDSLLRVNPRQDWALLNKGVALHSIGKWGAALDCFNQVLARRPENTAALNNKGATLLRLGRLEEALESFDSALALEPQNEEVQKNRCLLLLRLGRYGEAVRAAAEMLATCEESWLWMLKGLAHAELREIPLALQSLERAKELDPGLDGLEDALDRITRLRQAVERPQKESAPETPKETGEDSVTLPTDVTAFPPKAIAAVLNNMGYPTESFRVWQEALDKNIAEDWFGMSMALSAGGERDTATRCLRESKRHGEEPVAEILLRSLAPPDGRSLRSLMEEQRISRNELPFLWREVARLVSAGRACDAIDLLDWILSHGENLERGWNWLGVLRAQTGSLASAETAFRRAVEGDGEHATAWSNLGAVLACSGKLEEALAALHKAVNLDPWHLEALHNLGVVESRLGHDADSRRHLREAMRVEERAHTCSALAMFMERKNRWQEAARYYEKSLALDPRNAAAKRGLAKSRAQSEPRKKGKPRKPPAR